MSINLRAVKRRDRIIVGLALAAVTAGVISAGTYSPVMAKPAPAGANLGRIAQPSFADIVEAVSPAVVAISVKGSSNPGRMGIPEFQLPPGSPFEDFFERFFRNEGQGNARPHRYNAQGSGFVVDPNGLVVTNHHVVKGADAITVITAKGEELAAEIKGFDTKTDLAVLEVESDGALPYVVFGDSDKARVGDWVLAIGNPFGLGGSATSGIISARGRDINAGPLDDFIQIDAPINRGNSGGPLFDANGEVIGVNTAIFSPNGGNVGIGFAIPSSTASSIVGQLVDKGHVERGWLGVQIQHLTEDLAESLGMSEARGALVSGVVEDGPAETAGIRVGDVILTFDGREIEKMRDLPRIVADTPANSRSRVEVWRKGERRTLAVKIGESAREQAALIGGSEAPAKGELGLTLAELNEETRARFRVSSESEGALVVRVAPDSPAAEKGIRPGDVIKRVGSAEVRGPDEVVRELRKAADDERSRVLLLVERDGADRFVAVGIG
jgi:serine protease Do